MLLCPNSPKTRSLRQTTGTNAYCPNKYIMCHKGLLLHPYVYPGYKMIMEEILRKMMVRNFIRLIINKKSIFKNSKKFTFSQKGVLVSGWGQVTNLKKAKSEAQRTLRKQPLKITDNNDCTGIQDSQICAASKRQSEFLLFFSKDFV